MSVTSEVLLVVAVALLRPDNSVLMQQRPRAKEHGGLWEFPGGKIESGESVEAALVREIAEELAVQLDPANLEPLAFASTGASGREIDSGPEVVLLLYTCRVWQGEPQNLEAEALGWFAPNELLSLPMPPLDVPLAKSLITAINGLAKADSCSY